jgi:hypothetical protein
MAGGWALGSVANGQQRVADAAAIAATARVARAHGIDQHRGRRDDAERVAQSHAHALDAAEDHEVGLGVGRGRDGHQIAAEFETDDQSPGEGLSFGLRGGGVADGRRSRASAMAAAAGATEGRTVVGGVAAPTDDTTIEAKGDGRGDETITAIGQGGHAGRVEGMHGIAEGREETDGVLGLGGLRRGC